FPAPMGMTEDRVMARVLPLVFYAFPRSPFPVPRSPFPVPRSPLTHAHRTATRLRAACARLSRDVAAAGMPDPRARSARRGGPRRTRRARAAAAGPARAVPAAGAGPAAARRDGHADRGRGG